MNFWEKPLKQHHKVVEKVSSFITPILETFHLSQFTYFFVDSKGNSSCLCSSPKWMEYYLKNNLFKHNPFLKAPSLIQEGIYFTQDVKNPLYHRTKNEVKDFEIGSSIILIKKSKEKLTAFSFGLKEGQTSSTHLINSLPLLKKFCSDFEKKKALLELEQVNLISLVGENTFFKTAEPFFFLEEKKKKLAAHLKLSYPKLSSREQECLSLYLLGETAVSIADHLKLSPRTVESHLENLKRKFDCTTRSELLKKASGISTVF